MTLIIQVATIVLVLLASSPALAQESVYETYDGRRARNPQQVKQSQAIQAVRKEAAQEDLTLDKLQELQRQVGRANTSIGANPQGQAAIPTPQLREESRPTPYNM